MNINRTCALALTLPLLLSGAPAAVKAKRIPNWNLIGTYNGYFYVQEGYYGFQMVVSKENPITGVFSGTLNGGGNGKIVGTISGSSFNFQRLSDGYTFQGSATLTGKLGGDMQAYGPGGTWQGWWGANRIL